MNHGGCEAIDAKGRYYVYCDDPCHWESKRYDNPEEAFAEWEQHVAQVATGQQVSE